MKKQGIKRQLVGTVISNKMDKTVVVAVEQMVQHKFYHKHIRRRTNFAAHDEGNVCQVGDQVMLIESRPLSRSKKWRVRKIVKKAV